MQTIDETVARVEQLLQEQLAWAQRAHRSVSDSVRRITEGLEDLGMRMGFLPIEPLETKPGFRGATVVLGLNDYETEVTVTV